jgi:hypothetical protein
MIADAVRSWRFDFEQPAQFTTPAVGAEHQRDAGGDDHASAIPRTTPDLPITSELPGVYYGRRRGCEFRTAQNTAARHAASSCARSGGRHQE